MESIKSGGKPLLSILIVGFLLRLYFATGIPTTNGDGIYYSWIALNLAEGYGFTIAEGVNLFEIGNVRMPLYPVSLSIVYRIFGAGFFISKILSLIFGTMIIFFGYLLAEKMFDRTAALFTALLLAFNPLLSYFSAEIMAESMYILLVLVFFYLLFLALVVKKDNSRLAGLAGLLAAFAYLTKINGILLLIVGLIFYASISLKKSFLNFFIVFILVISPWLLWSHQAYGEILAPEKSTAGFQYEMEFGEKLNHTIEMADYLLNHHSKTELYKGFIDGTEKNINELFVNSFFGYSGLLQQEDTSNRLLNLSRLLVVFGIALMVVGALFRREGEGLFDFAVGMLLLGGLILPAWQIHLVPWPEPRYASQLIPFFTIYFAGGISHFYRARRPLGILISIIFILSFIHSVQGHVSIEKSYIGVSYIYSFSPSEIPIESILIASNAKVAESLGFSTVHPLEKRDFKALKEFATDHRAEYLLIDSSSLYNQDQILLLSHWYPERIPGEFSFLGQTKYKASLYRIEI